jgi:hypothetical protein
MTLAKALPMCGVQALLLVTGSIQAALPVIAAIFTGVIACWIRAVSVLHNTIKVNFKLQASSPTCSCHGEAGCKAQTSPVKLRSCD